MQSLAWARCSQAHSHDLHQNSAHIAFLQHALLGVFMFGMRHGKKTECFANLRLLRRGDAVLFRELRGAFNRRRLGGRTTSFRRLSRVSCYPSPQPALQNSPCRVFARVETRPCVGGCRSTPFASMTRLHGPPPRRTQASSRTPKFFASSPPPSCLSL